MGGLAPSNQLLKDLWQKILKQVMHFSAPLEKLTQVWTRLILAQHVQMYQRSKHHLLEATLTG